MVVLDLGALLVALVITIVEMTEVVAVVFALGAEAGTIRHGAMGAIVGTAAIALLALGSGAALLALPRAALLCGAAATLVAFGVFLFRGTIRAYRRARSAAPPPSDASRAGRHASFAGGVAVGAVEATEAAIVLLALAAAGDGSSAIVGALIGGAALVATAALVHERIRRIKVPLLRLGATSMLFAFAVFWAGEAAGLYWPFDEVALVPLFLLSLLVVRGAVEVALRRAPRVHRNG